MDYVQGIEKGIYVRNMVSSTPGNPKDDEQEAIEKGKKKDAFGIGKAEKEVFKDLIPKVLKVQIAEEKDVLEIQEEAEVLAIRITEEAAIQINDENSKKTAKEDLYDKDQN